MQLLAAGAKAKLGLSDQIYVHDRTERRNLCKPSCNKSSILFVSAGDHASGVDIGFAVSNVSNDLGRSTNFFV